MTAAVSDRQGATVIVPHSNGRSRKHESTVTTYKVPEGLQAIGLVKRLSQAKTEAALQVDAMARQDVTEEAEAAGPVYVHKVYEDPNHSGSKKHVERPAFELAVRDLLAGVIMGLAVLDIDRLTRRHLILEQLIDFYEDHPGLFWYCDDPSCDLTTDAGRKVARAKVDDAAAYAAAVKLKTTRRHAQARKAGVMVGARGYGHTTTGEEVKAEADVIRLLADAVDAGVNMSDFLTALTLQGVRGKTGSPLTQRTVKGILTSPRLVGLRVDTTTADGWAVDADGQPIQGTQAVILDMALWLRVRKAYEAREVDTRYRKYVASEVLRCGSCGHHMNGQRMPDGHRYYCQAPKGQCDARAMLEGTLTDKYILRLVELELMKDTPEVAEALPWPKADELSRMLARKEAHRAKRTTMDTDAWLDQNEALALVISGLKQEQRVWLAQHPEPEGQPTHEVLEAFRAAVAADDVPAIRRIVRKVLKAVTVAAGGPWSEARLQPIPQAQA